MLHYLRVPGNHGNIYIYPHAHIQDEKQIEVGKGDTSVKPARPKDLGFLHAFAASISVIIVSELGDKTFFIAAILAMKSSRSVPLLFGMLSVYLPTLSRCHSCL